MAAITNDILDGLIGRRVPGIGVGVVLYGNGSHPELGDVKDGRARLLLCRRGELRTDDNPRGVRNEPNRWDLPGGGVAFNESLAQAVEREMYEELGVLVHNVRHLHHLEHFPNGQHWVSHTHRCRLLKPTATPTVPEDEREKLVELRYFTLRGARMLPRDEVTTSLFHNLDMLNKTSR